MRHADTENIEIKNATPLSGKDRIMVSFRWTKSQNKARTIRQGLQLIRSVEDATELHLFGELLGQPVRYRSIGNGSDGYLIGRVCVFLPDFEYPLLAANIRAIHLARKEAGIEVQTLLDYLPESA